MVKPTSLYSNPKKGQEKVNDEQLKKTLLFYILGDEYINDVKLGLSFHNW